MFPRQQRLSRRCARLYPILLVAIALIIFALPTIASATTFSEVALMSRWGPHIYGQQYSPLAPVRVVVADSEGILKGSAESSVSAGGLYMFFEEEILAMDAEPIELRRGDLITVTIGAGGSVTVVEIEAELAALFSSEQNKIFVEALPNQAIGVFKVVGDSFESLTQGLTDSKGKLVLNQAIPPNEFFYIMSADANINFTSLELWPAYGMLNLDENTLWGSGYISDSTATVEVYDGSVKLAEKAVTTDSDGDFNAEDFSPEIDIVSGNTIKVIARYVTAQFVAKLEADMDYVDDTIQGKTTPNSFLVASVAPGGDFAAVFNETATASAAGDYMITAALESGDFVWLASIHPDGNITRLHREFGTASYSHGNPVIFANKQNQHAAAISIEELGPRSISSHTSANKLTLEIQTAGVTFSGPPQATCDGVELDGEAAALSPDRRTATWSVSECTTQTTGGIMIEDITYDADAGTPDGAVALAVGGNSGVTAELVSNAVAINDSSAPETTIIVSPAEPNGKNDWYITAPLITLVADGTATIYYQWDADTTETTTSPVQITALEGQPMLTYFAVDEADNTETAQSRLFKVDTTKPTTPAFAAVETITPSNMSAVFVGGAAESDTTVTVTASDGDSLIETTTASNGSFSIIFNLSSFNDTDSVAFTAQAEDEAGNLSTVSSITAIKDTLPPITTIKVTPLDADGENGWYVTTPTVELSVDETATIFYRWGAGEENTYTIPLFAPIGESTLTAFAIDIEGDTGTPVSKPFKFDPAAPTWSPSSTFTASEIGQTSVKLSWGGDTDTVGVTGYRIYSGVGTMLRATLGSVESTTIAGLTPGTQYTFTIQARDAAGRWSGDPSCGPSVVVTTASSSGGGGSGGGGGTSDASPVAPQGLKVLSTQNMIRLGWTANTESDLAGYNVYRKVKDASGGSTKLNATLVIGIEYQDTTAQLGMVYVYYVTAVDNGNIESQKSNEVEASRIAVLADEIFFDVRPGDWFVSFVSRLNSLNIIEGYPDKSFRPHQNLTRAEFAKMLCLAMGWELHDPSTPFFNDVAREHWSYRYVETAKARGALGGYPTGEFRPNNSITRAEIAAAIARALNLSDGSSDLTDIALHWAKDHISACVKAGIISGYPGNVFRPNANATRAEASKMIAGVLDNK